MELALFVFSQIFWWFIRNNIITVKYIAFIIFKVYILREAIYFLSKNKFLQWFIPFFRENIQAQNIFQYPQFLTFDNNLSKTIIEVMFRISQEQKYRPFIVANIFWKNSKELNELENALKKNRTDYWIYFHNSSQPSTSLINRVELEYYTTKCNMWISFGSNTTHSIVKASNIQTTSKKPIIYFEMINNIKTQLYPHITISTTLTETDATKFATVYSKKRQILFIDKNIQPTVIMKNTPLIKNNNKQNKLINIANILTTAISAILSNKKSLMSECFAEESIKQIFQIFDEKKVFTKENTEKLNYISAMTGLAINNSLTGYIEAISQAINKIYKINTNKTMPVIMANFLKLKLYNKVMEKQLDKIAIGLNYPHLTADKRVRAFINDFIKILEACNVLGNIPIDSGVVYSNHKDKLIVKHINMNLYAIFSLIRLKNKNIHKLINNCFLSNIYVKKPTFII